MIVVRSVLHAKFGMGGELAKLALEINQRLANDTGWTGQWRIMTDLSGTFDTVVLETEVESLAAWDQLRTQLFAQPAFRDTFPRMRELVQSGKAEYFTIEGAS